MSENAPPHSDAEEAILEYIYNRPEEKHSTESLASGLQETLAKIDQEDAQWKSVLGTRGDEETGDSRAKPKRKPEDLQREVESLIVKRLVTGKHTGTPGNITHVGLKLTQKGAREAMGAAARTPRHRIIADL